VPGFRHPESPHPAGTLQEWGGRSLPRAALGQLLRQKPQAAVTCLFAVTPETLITCVAAMCVIPWTSTGSNASSSSSGQIADRLEHASAIEAESGAAASRRRHEPLAHLRCVPLII
jgi:hypothetical protein